MSGTTNIEWTDATWNPIRGCSRVSEGCRHCYAEGVAYRFSGPGQAYEGLVRIGADGERRREWNGQIRFVDKDLLKPLSWRKPRRIFVNSMSDLFHENVTDEMRDKIFAVMALSPQHTFQVLTKRPGRMLEYLRQAENASPYLGRWQKYADDMVDNCAVVEGRAFPLANVWLGVSVENQKTADERIPLLLQTPAAKRFISAEPLLGPIILPRKVYLPKAVRGDFPIGHDLIALSGYYAANSNPHGALSIPMQGGRSLGIKPDEFEDCGVELDWVIVGGESGHGARPMSIEWVRGLRDQCQSAGVPFFFKQWGEWAMAGGEPSETPGKFAMLPQMQYGDASPIATRLDHSPRMFTRFGSVVLKRVGKKAAGHLLDGKEFHEFPSAAKP